MLNGRLLVYGKLDMGSFQKFRKLNIHAMALCYRYCDVAAYVEKYMIF